MRPSIVRVRELESARGIAIGMHDPKRRARRAGQEHDVGSMVAMAVNGVSLVFFR